MASIRRYGRWAVILLTGLFLLAVVVQIVTAGFGIFGATSLDLHEDLGFSLAHGLSILIFLAGLVAWIELSGLALAFLVGALTTVQVFSSRDRQQLDRGPSPGECAPALPPRARALNRV